jgi:hypothetical protein
MHMSEKKKHQANRNLCKNWHSARFIWIWIWISCLRSNEPCAVKAGPLLDFFKPKFTVQETYVYPMPTQISGGKN